MSAPSTLPLEVSTVFISSRMEEVAIERRAAFSAAYESGLVPLLFETEPGRVGLKDKLDQLVDRAHLFAGIYYRTFGLKYEEELFGMTPIEYEFFRFLEVWKARHEHDDQGAGGASRWSVGGAESQVADDALNKLREVKRRQKHLNDLWRVARIDDDHWEGFKSLRDYEENPSLGTYRFILRARVCMFTRGDGEDSTLSSDLANFLPPQQHFCRSRFCAELVSRGASEPLEAEAGSAASGPPMPAERFTEPHVVLYRQMKERLKKALVKRVLKVEPRHGLGGGPDSDPGATLRMETQDRSGLLEEILEVLFSAALNISVLVSDVDGKNARLVFTIHSSREGERVDVKASHDVQVRLRRQVRDDALRIDTIELVSRRALAWEILARKTPFEDSRTGTDGEFFSLRISGADVPGILLSIARVMKESQANIVQIEFTSDEDDHNERSHHSYLSFNYFTGDVVVQMKSAPATEMEKQILELRYKLLNLLGVQAVRIKPVRPTS